MRRRVAILGSTGSIGTQALDVIRAHPERFFVCGLAAGKQTEKLAQQCSEFEVTVFSDASDGAAGLLRVALDSGADVILAATDGFVAFEAVFSAVGRGIDIALANKELIVAAGDLLLAAAKASGAQIVPVDSEHSAIFQCLIGEDPGRVEALVLTASGGPFWRWKQSDIEHATLDAALSHPTWRMGTKNTVDSATMMNKGLEAIEASRLFGFRPAQVRIVVHPQSIVHGMLIFTDGNVKMQAAAPDMRLPIGYALAYPDRLMHAAKETIDPLVAIGGKAQAESLQYTFERPDPERFPCIRLAYEALDAGGTMPAVLSAANEIAVGAFVRGEVPFGSIAAVIEGVMTKTPVMESTLESIRQADALARERARALIAELRTATA